MPLSDPIARAVYEKTWKQANPEKVRAHELKRRVKKYAYYKKWRRENLSKAAACNKAWRKKSPENELSVKIRNRIAAAMRSNQIEKHNKSVELLGCSVKFYRRYLEALWLPGMTWANFGLWEIDHIRPISSFRLSAIKEQEQAFHYTNTQPLWLTDNRQKSSKRS